MLPSCAPGLEWNRPENRVDTGFAGYHRLKLFMTARFRWTSLLAASSWCNRGAIASRGYRAPFDQGLTNFSTNSSTRVGAVEKNLVNTSYCHYDVKEYDSLSSA